MVRSIGADHVIDYTQEDFTKSGQIYDVIFGAVGKNSFSGSIKSVRKKGFYLSIKSSSSEKTEELITLKELIEGGKI